MDFLKNLNLGKKIKEKTVGPITAKIKKFGFIIVGLLILASLYYIAAKPDASTRLLGGFGMLAAGFLLAWLTTPFNSQNKKK